MKATLSLQSSQKLISYLLVASMVVLKGIPSVLSPELLYALAKMGHGDELGMFYFPPNCIKIVMGRANSHLKCIKSEPIHVRTALHFYSPVATNVLLNLLTVSTVFLFW